MNTELNINVGDKAYYISGYGNDIRIVSIVKQTKLWLIDSFGGKWNKKNGCNVPKDNSAWNRNNYIRPLTSEKLLEYKRQKICYIMSNIDTKKIHTIDNETADEILKTIKYYQKV